MKIIFVCLGNICRSPMAEFVMKNLSDKHEITSAGTAGYHDGEDMHQGTKKLLQAKGINANGFVSKKLTQIHCMQNDLIIAMDESNYNDICRAFPKYKSKVKMLCEYCDLGYKNVPDPWYTGNFDEVYMIVKNSCQNLLEELENN